MCGLVGVAGNILPRDLSFFKQALHADEFRGAHSTGITRVRHTVADGLLVDFVKMALPISQFKYMPMYGMVTANIGQSMALIGHNRHATKGAADNHDYAHPFQHGHINLMHNGSLTTHFSLTKETFTVDSEAICKAMSEQSPEELIPKLKGAFALVWVDEKAQTLNFVRNDERPLAIATNAKRDTIYWASESDMLKWLLDRDTLTTSSIDYDEIVELPIGEVWSYPLTKDSVNVASKVVTEVELAPKSYSHYNGYGNGYSNRSYNQGGANSTKGKHTSTTHTKTTQSTQTSRGITSKPKEGLTKEEAKYRHNDVSENHLKAIVKKDIERLGRESNGLRSYISIIDSRSLTDLGERIALVIDSFAPYQGGVYGQALGQMVEYPYSPVVIHGMSRNSFSEYQTQSDGLVTGYLSGVTCPPELTNRLSMTAEEMLKFKVTLRSDTVCHLRNLDDWEADNCPNEAVQELLDEKKPKALPVLAAANVKK